MKLLINTASTLKGGGVQVAKSFIEEVVSFKEHEYHVVLGATIAKLIDKKSFPANFYFYEIPYRPATRVFSIRRPDAFFRKLEKKIKPDCIFTPSGPAYWRPRAPHLLGYNLPHYVYRDSPFFTRLSGYRNLYWTLKGMVIRYYVKRDADVYVTQTDDVSRRLIRWINREKVFTVTNTFGSHFEGFRNNGNRFLAKRQGEYRLLMLSAWYHHKNFEIINAICQRFVNSGIRDVKFVLTLPGKVYDDTFSAVAKQFIFNVGPVKPNECPQLYHECDSVFLPTLLECFSANYAEAMIMRKPILTSDLDFAHTVCREAALYFNPLEADDIVDKIMHLKSSPSLTKRLVDEGLVTVARFCTPRQRAAKYLELCEALIQNQ